MLCPKCGAYSPYNTSQCNRCGAKLSGEDADKPARTGFGKKYYRNASRTKWDIDRENLLNRANDALDVIKADKRKRIILIAAAIVCAVILMGLTAGCVSCMCSGCSDCGGSVSSSDAADVGQSGSVLPSDSDVASHSDAVSASDAVSQSDMHVPVPADHQLVFITDWIPTAYIDIRYASEDNFLGQKVYDFELPQLRYGTVRKLMEAQKRLEEKGFRLKIWDGYRPTSAQHRLWEIMPDARYVSDPSKGYSGHTRGNTVDLTIVTMDGREVIMPTDYDDFTAAADRDYSDVSELAAENALMLEKIMTECGFRGYSKEWWHYTDTTEYPVIDG